MNVHTKIARALLDSVYADLERPHAFAHERVGFLFAGATAFGRDLVLTCREYGPVADEDYIDNRRVGAMMGSAAIRKALQHSYQSKSVALHVHVHGHHGRPSFSGVDLSENAKFVPNFFNVSPQRPHGAIVLSYDAMRGNLWLRRDADPIPVSRFSVIGAPLWTDGEAA